MKKLFYLGILGFILFEIANVYFIMPIPGSQEMNSIGIAYFLTSWKWAFRGLFLILILLGLKSAFGSSKWLPAILTLVLGVVFYETNYEMAADTMFYQPKILTLKNKADNKIDKDRLIIGIENKGEAKAYPIQFLGYHHQVFDSIGGEPVIVTYCTVCRTGRVFEPIVNGQLETFRLVGMDHFNAMFEDKTTKSWWRQATGEACAGKLKGQFLPEFPSTQTTLDKWFELYPNSLVMQPDPTFQVEYDSISIYEKGRLTGKLTRRDTVSWQNKSWIAGISLGKESKAYDWIELQQKQIINDKIDNKPVVVLLADDKKSLFAFIRNDENQLLTIRNDTLSDGQTLYNLQGKSLTLDKPNLTRVNVYQEYWHSWKTFHGSDF